MSRNGPAQKKTKRFLIRKGNDYEKHDEDFGGDFGNFGPGSIGPSRWVWPHRRWWW